MKVLAVMLLSSCQPAFAEVAVGEPTGPLCGSFSELNTMLADEFGEFPSGVGLQSVEEGNLGNAIIFYYSVEGGTWSIVETKPDGHSCIVMFGTEWVPEDAPVAGERGA